MEITDDKLNILVIGDPHIMESSYKDIEELNDKIVKFIETTPNIDFVVILGDLLDKHERTTVYPHFQAVKFLKSIKKYLPTFLLIGNHDRPHNTDFLSDIHFFTGLDECKNLYIIDKIKIYNICKINGVLSIKDYETCEGLPDTNKFVFGPYVSDGRLIEALNTKRNYIKNYENIVCMFLHQNISGVMINGMISTTGDQVPGHGFPLIISGHIHEHQYLPHKKVVYVGSSRQIHKNEAPDKTVSVFKFDLKDENYNFEELRIDLNLRKKVTITVEASRLSNLILPENASIYLLISGNSSEIKALKKNQTFRTIEKDKSIRISYNIIDPDPIDAVYNIKVDCEKKESLPYLVRLKDKIKSNPEHLILFNEIFG